MSDAIPVHVWADIACPWCYLGKRRFERAAGEYGEEIVLTYHSFELAPDTPVDFDGTEADFLAKHKGLSTDQVGQLLDRVSELGWEEGLELRFDRVRHTKTLKAHELLHHARAEGRQLQAVERLFEAYFEEGRHLGRIDELVSLAGDIGLDIMATGEALESGRYADAVRDDIATANRLGIGGVPFYVIDGRYGVSGAQDPAIFLDVLLHAEAERDDP